MELSRDSEVEYDGKIKTESMSAYEENSKGAGLASAYFKTGVHWENNFDVCENIKATVSSRVGYSTYQINGPPSEPAEYIILQTGVADYLHADQMHWAELLSHRIAQNLKQFEGLGQNYRFLRSLSPWLCFCLDSQIYIKNTDEEIFTHLMREMCLNVISILNFVSKAHCHQQCKPMDSCIL